MTANVIASRSCLLTLASLASMLVCAPLSAQQQVVDPDFKVAIDKPAYSGGGPIVAIDEAHSNFHTAGGQYKPFADLFVADGYQVVGW